MQGHSDHDDEGTPGQGPPPHFGQTAAEQPAPSGFEIPPDPYRTDDKDEATEGAETEPNAPTEAFRTVSRLPTALPDSPPRTVPPDESPSTEQLHIHGRSEPLGQELPGPPEPIPPAGPESCTERFDTVDSAAAASPPPPPPDSSPLQGPPPKNSFPQQGPPPPAPPPPTEQAPWGPHREVQPPPAYGHAPPPPSSQQPHASSYDFADLYPQRAKGSKRGLMIASLVMGAFLVLGGSAYAYSTFLGSSPSPDSGPVAISTPDKTQAAEREQATPPSPPPPRFVLGEIRNAKVDPKPLTLGEEFPKQEIVVGGHQLARVATDMTKKCGNAAQPRLEGALHESGCKRVLRATFVNAKYAVTTGVAVMPTSPDARAVEQAANARKQIWFAPLPGPKGSGARDIRRSGGYSAIRTMGHYVVFSFAAYTDTRQPPPKSRDLSGLCAAMRDYATEPIRARGMVTPKPASH